MESRPRVHRFGADFDADLDAHYEPGAITRNLLHDDADNDDDDDCKTPSRVPSLSLRTPLVPWLPGAVPPPFRAYGPVLHRRNKMPSLQIALILALPIPGRQPDAPLPHRHHSRRDDVPQIQRDNIRRHKINLLALFRRYGARIRSRLRPPHRRLHLHSVRDPILFHHQVIRSRIPPQLRHPKPLLHRPRQKPHLRPLSPLLGIPELTPALSQSLASFPKKSPKNTNGATVFHPQMEAAPNVSQNFYSILIVCHAAKGKTATYALTIFPLLAST